ncbi:HAD family hydrolase [Fusibacter paucivorans]|nr:HAD family phosphatase [Fusibacter paucivorans]
MTYLENIEAIIFDLDGTLVDSMWIWKQIDIDFLEKRGIVLPEDLQKDIEGMSFTETAQYFMDRFQLNEPMEAIKDEWNAMAKDFYANRIPLKHDVKKIINHALKEGIKLGIGTSNSRELLMTVLEAHQMVSHFDAMRTSCEVKVGKPSPDIFLKVAEDLDVLPSKCLVFEDTYAGVQAARNAGMRVIAIYDEISAPYHSEIAEAADHFIFGFSEIADDRS